MNVARERRPRPALWALRGALLLLLCLTAARLGAQTYPAIVNLTMTPPYSPYLTDMLLPGQERVLINVNFLDQAEPSWDAKLRLTIEGNGLLLKTSRPFYRPVTLSPGPNLIDPVDFEPLFDFSKMDVQGANKNDLVNAGRLPEGTYTFCLEVLDAGREVPISLPACVTATLIQNNPPQLTTPECGAVISAAGNPSITFNWIPMHDPSIQVEYQIKLVQVPAGMNVNDAINATSFPILDWVPVNGTSFVYGPEFVPLDPNQKYAFQIRVVDLNGLTTFENDGKSPVCWFTYGYSTDGTIELTAPAHQTRVDDPTKVDFAWGGPSNATPGQPLKYHIKVVKLAAGERVTNQAVGASYMSRTQGVWYDDSTDIMPNIYGGNLTVEQQLEPDTYYAWQVWSSTDGIKTAKSQVWEFKSPPVIFAFWCADGAYMVTVTNTTNFTKVSETKYTNLTGTGTVVLAEGEQPTEVSYSGLTVEVVANKWVLKVGEIVVPRQEAKELDFEDYGDGTFDINAWVLTSMEFLAQGQLRWRFPLSVNSPGNAVVTSAENVRLNYLNKILSGAVAFADNQSYNLLIPMGYQVKYRTASQFIVASSGKVKLKLSGDVYFPGNLKTVSGNPFSVSFENIENPWYMEVPRMSGGEQLKLFSNSKVTLQPKSFVVDFTGSKSPPGQFSSQAEWVGVYITEYNIFLPTDLDDNGQLALNDINVLTFVSTDPGYQPAWISSGGLNLDVRKTFEHADAPPYYAKVNTFSGKLTELRLKIEDNSLSASQFTGFIKVPFLDPGRKLDWIAPIAANGIQRGYFNEDSVQAFSKTYNPTDALANIKLDINQAVFEDGDHINMNVNLSWPYLKVVLDHTGGLKVWGNGEIGFNEVNGKKDLPYQVPVTMGNFSGVADGVGAFYENTVYGFQVYTKASFPGGITSPGIPVKVGVAGPGGGPPPPIVYTRVDGKVKEGKFRIGPVKFELDNSLVNLELFADYIDDDKDFGTRFEAKGNILVKQPNKMVAQARFVAGEKGGTGFWYARCYAQGLNKLIESYPAFHLNGFDFKIYHHLARPQGTAFKEPGQFKDFWAVNTGAESANSIDGHALDGSVALGMYGKIGVHDAASGRKQKSPPVKITETVPSIGDILPNIPGLCDLQYNGKSVCSYVRWPWEGLSMCDIQVPYVQNGTVAFKSICQVDFFSVDWPKLQLCDLKMPSGKKVGDYTLGELGFDKINLCDLKLPNGSGLCSYFDISGSFCDIRDASGPICQKKLCNLLPQIPPVCQWKFPGVKAMCQFKIGDLIPSVEICAIKGMDNKSLFCDWSWPDILPDIPNPCDFKLPNGTKLCSITASWCDIMVPVMVNGNLSTKPLCQVKWWEIDWPHVNVCEWKIGGQPLCSLNVNFCDLVDPVTNGKACDFLPDMCDLVEPISGKRFCDLGLFDVDWPSFNFCSLKWPGTERSVCNLPSLRYCDLKNPFNGQRPWLCDFKLPNLIPTMPSFCDLEIPLPEGGKRKLCELRLNIELPSICDLKLVDDLQLCKIKLPSFDLPEVNIPPVPGLPGLPENMYQQLLMGGVSVEVQNSGSIRQIGIEGCGWFFTDRFDPNGSYLARGFGGVEFWPQQNKIQLHMEAETGGVKTDLGTIKPICGKGTMDALFSPQDWYIHVGSPRAPWEVNLGCASFLSCEGFVVADKSGILAHGEINRRAETHGGFDMGIGEIDFWAKAHLDIAAEIGVSFDNPKIYGSIAADAGASAGVTVTALGVSDDYEFASVAVGGDLSFSVGSDFCMAGKLYGEVSVMGEDVEVSVGVEVNNSGVSFPEDPDRCY